MRALPCLDTLSVRFSKSKSASSLPPTSAPSCRHGSAVLETEPNAWNRDRCCTTIICKSPKETPFAVQDAPKAQCAPKSAEPPTEIRHLNATGRVEIRHSTWKRRAESITGHGSSASNLLTWRIQAGGEEPPAMQVVWEPRRWSGRTDQVGLVVWALHSSRAIAVTGGSMRRRTR
jgi:hypothetical protein